MAIKFNSPEEKNLHKWLVSKSSENEWGLAVLKMLTAEEAFRYVLRNFVAKSKAKYEKL